MEAPLENNPGENARRRSFIYRSSLYLAYGEFMTYIKRDGEIDFEIVLYRKLPRWVKIPRLKKPKRRRGLLFQK
jgi:hypothetical protein